MDAEQCIVKTIIFLEGKGFDAEGKTVKYGLRGSKCSSAGEPLREKEMVVFVQRVWGKDNP